MPERIPYGMDHDFWSWSPIAKRPALQWPNGARVAVCLLVDLGHYEWKPPEGAFDPPSNTAPMSLNVYPDYPTVTHREYGHRIGIYRIMEVLERHGVKATAPMDAHTADHYPILVRETAARGWEIAAHGVTQRQAITSLMSEEEEREYIAHSLESVTKACGALPAGWVGPAYSQSERTLTLLAEMGIRYVCDIPNDEQPYVITTPKGDLCALPVMFELGDEIMQFNRKVAVQHWARLVREAFDVLHRDGGRLLVLHVHPWCVGQPYRIKYFNEVVEHIAGHPGVWMATGAEIADWYRRQDGAVSDTTGPEARRSP